MATSQARVAPASVPSEKRVEEDVKSWGVAPPPPAPRSTDRGPSRIVCRRGESLNRIEREWQRQHELDLKKSGCCAAALRKPGGTGIARNIGDHMKRDDLRHKMYGPEARVHRMPDYSQDLFSQHFNLNLKITDVTEVFNPLGMWGKLKQRASKWHKSDWHYRMAFVEVCLLQPMVWFYVALFISFNTMCRVTRAYLEVGYCESNARDELMEIMSGTNVLNAFLFVFYVQRCYTWFMSQYNISCSLEGRAFDIVCRSRAYIADDAVVMEMYRWTNLIHILGYVGLSKSYTKENFFIPMSEAYGDRDCGLMSRIEREKFLERFGIESGGSAYRHAVTEALRVVHRAYKEGLLGKEEAAAIEASVISMRGKMAQLYDFAGMPIPVVYKISIHLSMHVWLITFTLEKAMLSDAFLQAERFVFSTLCLLAVLLVAFVVISLFAFSQLVNEPYGDDLFDLPVFSFVNMIAETTLTIAQDRSQVTDVISSPDAKSEKTA